MCARFVCFSWPFKGYVAYKEDVMKNGVITRVVRLCSCFVCFCGVMLPVGKCDKEGSGFLVVCLFVFCVFRMCCVESFVFLCILRSRC